MLFVIYRTRQRRQIGLTILKAVPYPLTPDTYHRGKGNKK